MDLGLGYEVGLCMRDVILKYKLDMKTHNSRCVELRGENCVIIISSDRTGVDMTFTNPKDKEEVVYRPWNYTNLVFGFYTIETEEELSDNDWHAKGQSVMYKSYVSFFNKVLLDYFEPVMNGDYTWKEKYVEYITEVRELTSFLMFEPEFEPINNRRRKKDITWLDDARELYKRLKAEEA